MGCLEVRKCKKGEVEGKTLREFKYFDMSRYKEVFEQACAFAQKMYETASETIARLYYYVVVSSENSEVLFCPKRGTGSLTFTPNLVQ